jgi:hypothetical protein
MKNHKRKLKAIVLSLMLAAGTMLPASVSAQEVVAETGGGLLGNGKLFGFDGMLFGDRDGESELELDITNADFGETVPLGSGLAILIGVGLGYVALKKKED